MPILSPMIFVPFALRPIPLGVIDMAVGKLARQLCTNHPGIIERLSDLQETLFAINIKDLGLYIKATISGSSLIVKSCRKKPDDADVYVMGELVDLLNMLGGNVDGDALFFSRNITVEGDTEALLTLRNAIDSEDINLKEEFLSLTGIFRTPTQIVFNSTEKILSTIGKNIESISDSITRPLKLQQKALCADNINLKKKVTLLEQSVAKQKKNIEKLAIRQST